VAIIASIVSSLPVEGGFHIIEGNDSQSVNVEVENTGLTSVQLKQVYLTQTTAASVSLGNPDFRYISAQIDTTNNIIPAGETRVYQANFIPQVPSLSDYPLSTYTFPLTAIIQFIDNSAQEVPELNFRVYPSKRIGYSIVSPFNFWSMHDNQRPPQNFLWDFSITVNELLENGQVIPVPLNELYFLGDEPFTAQITTHSDQIETTTENFVGSQVWQTRGPQVKPYGGCVTVNGPGLPSTFEVRRYSLADPVIGITRLQVIDAIPISLSITPALQQTSYPSTNIIRYVATVTRSNGSVEVQTTFCDWFINGILDCGFGYFVNGGPLSRGRLNLTNDSNQLTPYGYTPAVITAQWDSGISPEYPTLSASANLFVKLG